MYFVSPNLLFLRQHNRGFISYGHQHRVFFSDYFNVGAHKNLLSNDILVIRI